MCGNGRLEAFIIRAKDEIIMGRFGGQIVWSGLTLRSLTPSSSHHHRRVLRHM